MDGNGMILTGTSWFRDGVSVTDTVNDPNLPTGTPSILLIASPFTNANTAGTYTCSPNSTFLALPPGDNFTLTTESEYMGIFITVCFYLNSSTQSMVTTHSNNMTTLLPLM